MIYANLKLSAYDLYLLIVNCLYKLDENGNINKIEALCRMIIYFRKNKNIAKCTDCPCTSIEDITK